MSDISSEGRAAGAAVASTTGAAGAPRGTAASPCGAAREVGLDHGASSFGTKFANPESQRRAETSGNKLAALLIRAREPLSVRSEVIRSGLSAFSRK